MSRLEKTVVVSENAYKKQMDNCAADAIIKCSGGFIFGSLISILFFKTRAWPIFLGTAFGGGIAYRTCEKNLNIQTND